LLCCPFSLFVRNHVLGVHFKSMSKEQRFSEIRIPHSMSNTSKQDRAGGRAVNGDNPAVSSSSKLSAGDKAAMAASRAALLASSTSSKAVQSVRGHRSVISQQAGRAVINAPFISGTGLATCSGTHLDVAVPAHSVCSVANVISTPTPVKERSPKGTGTLEHPTVVVSDGRDEVATLRSNPESRLHIRPSSTSRQTYLVQQLANFSLSLACHEYCASLK